MNVTSGATTVHSEAFAYDPDNGNLNGKGADLNSLVNYTYSANQPHALTAYGSNAYTYDANGNQVTRQIGSTEFDLTFDAENHLVHVLSNQPFPTESYTWEPLTTPSPTPVITETPTLTATVTETLSPTATSAPVTAQVIGQCGPFTSTSASVDIPASTTMLIVVEGGSNHGEPTAYTVGGQALTLEVENDQATREVRIYWKNLPPTGTQTISMTGFSIGNGGAWGCYYLTGTDTSSPIRSDSYKNITSTSLYLDRLTEPNDIVIDVLGLRFSATSIQYTCGQSAGYTSLSNKTSSGYKTASGTTTRTCYSFNSNDASIASIAIKSAPLPTATPTNTFTPTATETHTPTLTPLPSNTPTITETPTPTNTLEPSPTVPSNTPMDTETPTATATIDPLITPTETPVETATVDPLITATETMTPTITETPTETFTPTITLTPSDTPVPSDTPTPSETPTPTETATETATATSTSSPTATATAVPIPGEAQYVYDGDGNMVKSVIGDVTTYYAGSTYEKKVVGSEQVERKYYFAGSSRIAMRENGTLTWLLSDNLGSTSTTAAADGSLLDTVKYTAFGEIRDGATATDYRYTGQRDEFEIGLYYYVARYYDPVVGRFISADTIVPQPGSSQAYDRYAYVNNNPINFNDPSGNRACDEEDCLDYIKYGTGKNSRPTTVKSLLDGGFQDTQALLRAYINAHPAYEPLKDPELINDRIAFSFVATAKMQVDLQHTPSLDERISNELEKPRNEALLANKYTPVISGAISVLSTDAMYISAITIPDPITKAIAVGVTYGIARASGLVGMFSTGYQYKHNLFGTTKADVEISAASTVISSVPKPDMGWANHAGFLYTFFRTFGDLKSP
jgi:RHS repeat-associated protein